MVNLNIVPTRWSRGNAFFFEAGGLRFNSRAGRIGDSAVLQMTLCGFDILYLCKKRCWLGAMSRIWAPQTCYLLWSNAASIMKDYVKPLFKILIIMVPLSKILAPYLKLWFVLARRQSSVFERHKKFVGSKKIGWGTFCELNRRTFYKK